LVSARNIGTRKFCSRSCAAANYNALNLRGPRNGRWRGGRALNYGPGWKRIREQVRARDKVCRDCGKTPEENGRALDVHHVDPYRFSGDHSLDKLKALCRSCHMRADDHGRRGSAMFLAKAGRPKPLSKREIRRREAAARAALQKRQRARLQRYAFRLHTLGRSLREIAKAAGVSHQTVANWLSARRGPMLS
jgi:5-methylcytosine-specific restriction endonuclease McrA